MTLLKTLKEEITIWMIISGIIEVILLVSLIIYFTN